MEEEVSVLMSVAEEVIWSNVRLFISMDELSNASHPLQLTDLSSFLSSTSNSSAPHLPSFITTTSPTLTSPLLTSPIHQAFFTTPYPSTNITTSQNTFHPASGRPHYQLFPHIHPTMRRPSLNTTTCIPSFHKGIPSGLCNTRQAIPKQHFSYGLARNTNVHTTRDKKFSHKPWAPKKTKKKLVLGVDIGVTTLDY